MTAVRRLRSLISSRALLNKSAGCKPNQEVTRHGENVWLLGLEGACGCFWEGVKRETTAESANRMHSVTEESGLLLIRVADRAANSVQKDALFGGYSSLVCRSRSSRNTNPGPLRSQKENVDLRESFRHTSTHARSQTAKACALTNSLQHRTLIANAHPFKYHQFPSTNPQLRTSRSQHSLLGSQHSLLGSQHSLSFGVFSRAFADSAAEAADVLVEHLGSDGSDHPTDADLDRALGEPTSKSSASDVVKGATPKVSIEATKLFNRVWNQVVIKMGGIESLNIPKEIVWLNGAPGSGKGANTPFILQTRGFPTKAISISSLLQDDKAAQEIMKSGALLSDSHVLELVLEGILKMGFVDSPDEEGDEIPDEDEIIAGVVVDGFPRTTMQVDFVKLLHDKLADLHYQHLSSPSEHHFPRPIFRIAVLYVEEEESVRRQLHRGRAAMAHNQRVRESGLGELVEVRETDLDEKAARRRYQIFREHYDTLLRLKSFFPFHLIDAMGTLAQCREQIAEELQYQSGLELGEDTFRAICHLPLAKNLVKQARQNMVTRLDSYMKHDLDTFKKVIDIVEHEVIPVVRRCALAGVALYNTERPFFLEHPEASEMLADVLSERGYYVTWQTRTREIPVKVDLTTGRITCEKRVSLQFRIKFDRPIIRNPVLYPSTEEKA